MNLDQAVSLAKSEIERHGWLPGEERANGAYHDIRFSNPRNGISVGVVSLHHRALELPDELAEVAVKGAVLESVSAAVQEPGNSAP